MPDPFNPGNQNPYQTTELSIAALWKKGAAGKLLRLIAPVVDRVLGIRRMRVLYERYALAGLDRFSFLERLITKAHIQYTFDKAELSRIPGGPVIIVANHPMGGLEGIVLMWILRLARPDYKFFVNIIDSFIVELKEFFIFTNPMAKGSTVNHRSLRLAREWLAQGHCLVVFPAGRVGIYSPEKGYVTDERWDEIALRLGIMTGAHIVPLFVEGQCSAFFSFMCRYIFPMKLLLLGWEFLMSFKRRVAFHAGRPIPASRLTAFKRKHANDWLRMRTYLECPCAGAQSEPAGVGAVSAQVTALVECAMRNREGLPVRGLRKAKLQQGVLHPEVAEYIARYGLDDREIEELAEALDGNRKTIGEILQITGNKTQFKDVPRLAK